MRSPDLAAVSANAAAMRARIDPRRAVLVALAGVIYGAGWAARKAVVAVLVAITWAAAVLVLGWTEAAPKKPLQQR